jgi:hypothetical protein
MIFSVYIFAYNLLQTVRSAKRQEAASRVLIPAPVAPAAADD